LSWNNSPLCISALETALGPLGYLPCVTAPATAHSSLPRIRVLYAQGQEAWGALGVEESFFIDRVHKVIPKELDANAAIDAIHAADFYLACACIRGDPRALQELDGLIGQARSAVQKVLGSSLSVDDGLQHLRRKLATNLDGPARIAEYSGRGPLKRWIRAVATRVALDLKRSDKGHDPLRDEDSNPLYQTISGPELDLVRGRDRPRFEAAFATALASLGSRERGALRLQVVEGLSLNAIGRVYGVNKSTVSRWLLQARSDVQRHLRRTLEKELHLRGSELRSFIGQFQSRLDASLSQFFGRSKP
jgi:RNA polymerase sigma-70 factor, ECF subfamily